MTTRSPRICQEIALGHIWKYGGTTQLKKALMDLPMEATCGQWGGVSTRVKDFCTQTISIDSESEVLEMFESLVSPNWGTGLCHRMPSTQKRR